MEFNWFELEKCKATLGNVRKGLQRYGRVETTAGDLRPLVFETNYGKESSSIKQTAKPDENTNHADFFKTTVCFM